MNVDNLTYGEKVVRVNFNVTGNPNIDVAKHGTAKLINEISGLGIISGPRNTQEEAEEIDRRNYERDCLMKKAVDAYELAAMYAVKALTV